MSIKPVLVLRSAHEDKRMDLTEHQLAELCLKAADHIDRTFAEVTEQAMVLSGEVHDGGEIHVCGNYYIEGVEVHDNDCGTESA